MSADLFIALLVLGVVVFVVVKARRRGAASPSRGQDDRAGEKGEAYFVSMFPDLQPHFHPEKLVAYVTARRGRQPARGGFTWKSAPGFGGPAVDIRFVGDREECTLIDGVGAAMAHFRFDSLPEGGVIHVGEGKFTVNLKNSRDPYVRYWHPAREFQWSRLRGWRFRTPVAERSFDSDDRGTRWSDSDSSSSGASRSLAGAAGFAGLGGTFDGGGASAGWDEKAGPSAGDEASGGASGDAPAAADDGTGSTAY